MRILLLHWGTLGGGPQMQVAIARSLVQDEAIDIALSYDAASEVRNSLAGIDVPQLLVGTYPPRNGGKFRIFRRVLCQVSDSWRLARFCRISEIGAVFEVMGHPLQILPRWVLRRSGMKVITSIHDAERHSGEESRILTWLSDFDLRCTDGVMTYSDAVADHLDTCRVPVFSTVHGAFGENSRREPRSLPTEYLPTVGFFGRVEKYKGLDRLAGAALELSARGRRVRLRVVGRGEIPQGTQALLAEAEAEIDNRWIEESEIDAVVGSFDVMVLPYDEASQSGVIGFALRAGVPIVCTPVGGLVEQVRLGRGVVADGMTEVDLADAIESVLLSAENYRAISSREMAAVEMNFSWRRVARDVVEAIEVIVGDDGLPARRRKG